MKRFLIFLALISVGLGIGYGASRPRVQSWWDDITRPTLPAAENAAQAVADRLTNTVSNSATNTPRTLPSEKNLAVPFTTQAPGANWDADHEEFCEEAAVVMVGRFFQGRTFSGTADAEQALQTAKAWELEHLGFYFDTTAAETAQMIEGLYNLHVDLVQNPSVKDIQSAIADGKLVIVPSAGRELGNPNFTAPGPIYHNLVIRGYTKNGMFITNDPGTRKGEGYVYDTSTIMQANHDWVPNGDRTIAANGRVDTGARVILVVANTTTP